MVCRYPTYGSGVPRVNTGSGRLHVELEYEYGDRIEWAFDAAPQAGAVQPTLTARCELPFDDEYSSFD